VRRTVTGKNQPFHRRLDFALAGLHETWRRAWSFRTQVFVAVLLVVIGAVVVGGILLAVTLWGGL